MLEEILKLKSGYYILGVISIINISIAVYTIFVEKNKFKKDEDDDMDNNVDDKFEIEENGKVPANIVVCDENNKENVKNIVDKSGDDTENRIMVINNICAELSILYNNLDEIRNKMDDIHKTRAKTD